MNDLGEGACRLAVARGRRISDHVHPGRLTGARVIALLLAGVADDEEDQPNRTGFLGLDPKQGWRPECSSITMKASAGRARDRQEQGVLSSMTFEEFFEHHRNRLFGAMCLVTGNRSEAEEITQEAFLKVWERWERVSRLESAEAYLFKVAMNLFRNRLRRAVLATRKVFALAPKSDDLAEVEDRDEVVRTLRSLPPRQRAALVLTTLLDLSSDEAAKLLGVQASTVRSLATQGRTGIREAKGEQT